MRAVYCPVRWDALVDKSNEHLRAEHPQVAGPYNRDEILIMAFDLL